MDYIEFEVKSYMTYFQDTVDVFTTTQFYSHTHNSSCSQLGKHDEATAVGSFAKRKSHETSNRSS